MALWQPTNADGVTQPLGSVVKTGAVANTVVLALADSDAHASNLVGSRIADVTVGNPGQVEPFSAGIFVRMVSEPGINDDVYLSATIAGSGDIVAPARVVLLGVCYEKIQIAGIWYAHLLPIIKSPNATIVTPTLSAVLAAGNTTGANVISAADGAVGAPEYTFTTDTATGLFHTGAGATSVVRTSINGTDIFDVAIQGITITQPVLNAQVPTALTVTGGAHTAITASTEDIGANFNFSATKTWATGALATQREVVFQPPRYAFVGNSTITNAATVAIAGPPVVGAHATITNDLALWVQTGNTWMNDRLGIGGGVGDANTPQEILHVFANNAQAFSATSPQAGIGTTTLFIDNVNTSVNRFCSILFHNPTGLTDGYVRLSAVGTATGSNAFVIGTTTGGTMNSRIYVNPQGNVAIGTGLVPDAASTLHVVASQTVVSAAGAAWNGVNIATSTLTLTGATTPITTLNFITIAAPTITAASPVVTTDFFVCRIGAATFAGAGPASATRSWSLGVDGNAKFGGGMRFAATDINVAGPYTILATDFFLCVRRTATAAITLNLPSIATVGDGTVYPIVDSGYNAAVNNITVTPNGGDKINNVAGNLVINITGSAIWLKANATTSNWEIV